MRLLVCGGRDFQDKHALRVAMNAVVGSRTDVVVIHGGARGADSLAGAIANEAKVPVIVFPADWDRYGKAAGYRRNREMLVDGKPDLVLAAPGGRGTAMMVRIAREAGVRVVEMGQNGERSAPNMNVNSPNDRNATLDNDRRDRAKRP